MYDISFFCMHKKANKLTNMYPKNLHSEADYCELHFNSELCVSVIYKTFPLSHQEIALNSSCSGRFSQAVSIHSANALSFRRCQRKVFRQKPGLIFPPYMVLNSLLTEPSKSILA